MVGRDGSQLRLEVVGPRGSAGGSASTPDHPCRPEGRLQQLVITTGQDSNWLVALAESVVSTWALQLSWGVRACSGSIGSLECFSEGFGPCTAHPAPDWCVLAATPLATQLVEAAAAHM